MKKKVLNILVVILTISIIVEGFICFKNIKNNKVLEDIKTVDIFDNKDKTLSIMVQDPTTFEYHEDSSRTSWPKKDEYMYAGSKCTDVNDKDLGDTTPYLKFDESNYTATITTKKTIYCTLYFAKGRPVLEVLRAHNKGANDVVTYTETLVDDLYRFKGTASQVTNNYICLGASENPDVCKANPNNMYRIIGVTTDGNLKVVKATKYGANKKWDDNSNYVYPNWTVASLYTYLNEDFYNSINPRIQVLIDKHTWNLEYSHMSSWNDNIKSDGTEQIKISLMQGSDFYYSITTYNESSNKDSWLFIKNGWNGNMEEAEWTMTRFDTAGPSWGWIIDSNGSLVWGSTDQFNAVRPSFYLVPTIGLIGEGTETNPYTVTTIK